MANRATESEKRPLVLRGAPPVSSRPSVAPKIQRQLDESSGNISLSRDEAKEVVLSLARGSKNQAKLYEYYAKLGDYAGRVVDWVGKETPNGLPRPVLKLKNKLEKELSGPQRGGGELCEKLNNAIENLSSIGLSVDFGMVRLAIKTYSERNELLHSRLGSREVADDLGKMAQIVEKDLQDLPSILPDDQIKNLDLWRKILAFYPSSQEQLIREERQMMIRTHLPDDVRQLAPSDRTNTNDGKFRQATEQQTENAKNRPQHPSDPTSEHSTPQKRKASMSPEPENTESAGKYRGKARKRLTRAKAKFEEKSEALKNQILELHGKDPRQALQWVENFSRQLNGEEAKFEEKSEALMNQILELHDKDPRQALRRVEKFSRQLNGEEEKDQKKEGE
ncbi:hypothetical protein FQN54_006759 [Arachnomyces sp. PD_36]|nr:hypothetical protein FQN54_006759 [Arachnomyces sp. PD_36]